MRVQAIIGIIILSALIGCAGAASVTVSVSDSSIGAGGTADIPVTISGADNMAGMDLTVTYDPGVLEFTGVKQGDLTKNGLVEANEVLPGTVNIGFVNPAGISGDGTLYTLGFTAVGEKGASSPVTLVNRGAFNLDRLDVPLAVTGGTVTVGDKAMAAIGTEVVLGALALAVLAAVYLRKQE